MSVCLHNIILILHHMRIQATDSTMEAVFRERYKSSSPPALDIYRHRIRPTPERCSRDMMASTRVYIYVYITLRRWQRGVCTRLSTLQRTWKGVAFQRGWFLKSDPESGWRMAFLVFIYVIRILCILTFFFSRDILMWAPYVYNILYTYLGCTIRS